MFGKRRAVVDLDPNDFGKLRVRMFEAAELRHTLAEAKQPLRTMVLLAVNCGFGQTDLARLAGLLA